MNQEERLDQRATASELAMVNSRHDQNGHKVHRAVDNFVMEHYQDVTDAGLALQLAIFYRPYLFGTQKGSFLGKAHS